MDSVKDELCKNTITSDGVNIAAKLLSSANKNKKTPFQVI